MAERRFSFCPGDLRGTAHKSTNLLTNQIGLLFNGSKVPGHVIASRNLCLTTESFLPILG